MIPRIKLPDSVPPAVTFGSDALGYREKSHRFTVKAMRAEKRKRCGGRGGCSGDRM